MPSARRFPPPWTIDEANDPMTYPRGIAYHEAGHAVVGWALGLQVGISRVFYDDAKDWKGGTDIADAGHLSLTEQIAICAAGYTAEWVFQCPTHDRAADGDNEKIYLLLKAAGILEQDHPARIADGNTVARHHLEAHRGKVIALAERLAECGHVDDASEFLEIGAMTARRFPPPWTIDEANDACFIVKDHNGHALAYVYFENEPGRRAAANLLTKDEARRIAVNIAKLPEWLRNP